MLTVLRRLVRLIQLFPDREASKAWRWCPGSPCGAWAWRVWRWWRWRILPAADGKKQERTRVMSILFLLGIAAAAVVLVLVIAAVTRR